MNYATTIVKTLSGTSFVVADDGSAFGSRLETDAASTVQLPGPRPERSR